MTNFEKVGRIDNALVPGVIRADEDFRVKSRDKLGEASRTLQRGNNMELHGTVSHLVHVKTLSNNMGFLEQGYPKIILY